MSTTERRQPKIRTKPRRKDLKKDENLCEHCAAKCCLYFALAIDEPTDWEDFELIRWFLLHERASVFTEEGEWYLLVHNKCKALREDHLCGAYETRPKICRDYTTDKCEYEEEWVYDHYFETPEQVTEYAEAFLGPRNQDDFRGPRPDALHVLGNDS
jgi:uncharacterized protein